MRRSIAINTVLVVLCLIGLNGCGKGQSGKPAAGDTAATDEHDHADEGPHGGHIIELGDENYHAELTHDEASHRVGIYLLGSDAKTAAPIEAESVAINVSVDGKATQYVLPAAPQAGESAGKASYFELDSEPLHTVVSGESESKNTQARISFTINGQPYIGVIETEAHEHDHDH